MDDETSQEPESDGESIFSVLDDAAAANIDKYGMTEDQFEATMLIAVQTRQTYVTLLSAGWSEGEAWSLLRDLTCLKITGRWPNA